MENADVLRTLDEFGWPQQVLEAFQMSDARRALEPFMSGADSELRALYAKA